MDHSQAKFNAAGSREIWCIHLTTLINDNSVKAADKARLKDSGVLRLTTPKIIKWLPNEAFIHKYSYTYVTTD